ncbi:MAG: carboxypeptidase-like regulatory domain-containing protein [Thermoplasmatota archaeon]
MRTKKRIAMGLFFLLGLSTLVFGAFVFYVTYELDSLDGRTVLTGMVLDTDEVPLQGVTVRCGDREASSGTDGKWSLNGVDEGLVTVEFYKDGFVRFTLKWLAYPLSDLGDDIEESANNISYSLKESGLDDIMLKREMEMNEVSTYSNGTLSVRVDASFRGLSGASELFYSNGTGEMGSIALNAEPVVMEVRGNGNFRVSLIENGPFVSGFHPVSGEIDITSEMMGLVSKNESVVWEGQDGGLNISMSAYEDRHPVSIVIHNRISDEVVDTRNLASPSDARFVLPPGVYSMKVHSRAYRDMVWQDIVIEEGSVVKLDVYLPEADVEAEFDDLSVKANYTLAVSYMVISLVLFFGGYYMKKGGSWAVLLILAFVGFLSKGLIDLYIFNINSLIAIILVIVLFSIRSEYNLKRQKLMNRKAGKA